MFELRPGSSEVAPFDRGVITNVYNTAVAAALTRPLDKAISARIKGDSADGDVPYGARELRAHEKQIVGGFSITRKYVTRIISLHDGRGGGSAFSTSPPSDDLASTPVFERCARHAS